MRLSVIIPAFLVPLLAVAGVWSGLLPLAGAASGPEDPVDGVEDPVDEGSGTGSDGEPTWEPPPTPIPVDPDDPDFPEETEPSPIEATGYLTNYENGIALVQTSRTDSPIHHGWVDVTLDFVLTSFVDDPTFTPSVSLSEEKTKVCFATTQERQDCLRVQWGSREQFVAELRPLGPADPEWAPGKAHVWAVTFEVPANAQTAGLRFGAHRLKLALGGQVEADTSGHVESESARPSLRTNAPPGTQGFWLGQMHGIAVTEVQRSEHEGQPTWVKVVVDLDVMRFELDGTMDTPIETDTTVKEACFVANEMRDCVQIKWGYGDAYDAILSSAFGDAARNWPRAKAWPHQLTFIVPANVFEATLVYGGENVHLDLLGESGPSPEWDYPVHYRPLTGLTLHDDGEHSVDLVRVGRDTDTADVILYFEAANRSENRDFHPRVTFEGARVSAGGQIFDGLDSPKDGWTPARLTVQGGPLAPGQREELTLVLPRVGGNGFAAVGHSSDPPDAMLVRLAADNNIKDGELGGEVRRFEPYYITFQRRPGDADATFFYPDLAILNIGLSESPATAGGVVDVVFTVSNLGPRNALASALDFVVEGSVVRRVTVPPIAAHQTVLVRTPWTVTLAPATLGAVLDPADSVEEAINENNEGSMTFPGGVLPDLVIGEVTLLAPSGALGTRMAVELRNQGLGRVGTSQVIATLSNGSRFFVSFPALEAGETAVREYPWTAAMGTTPVELFADGNEVIAEADETNNKAKALLPDLTYTADTRLVFDEAGAAYVEAAITNTGFLTSPIVTASMSVDGQMIMGMFDIGPLAPGETYPVRSPAVPAEGRSVFKMSIDPQGATPESDEGNNTLSFTYVVGPLAELALRGVTLTPTTFSEGTELKLEFYVTNTGQRASGETTVQVWDADVLLGSVDIPAIQTGEERRAWFEWEAGETVGDLLLIVDGTESVDELDEQNNTYPLSLP